MLRKLPVKKIKSVSELKKKHETAQFLNCRHKIDFTNDYFGHKQRSEPLNSHFTYVFILCFQSSGDRFGRLSHSEKGLWGTGVLFIYLFISFLSQ